jgi:MoCo/4Fe-4S cofactor protein with predicted Tat translocation signal
MVHANQKLRALVRQLDRERGRRLWRSIEELADTAASRAAIEAEFPALAPMLGEASRRDVLRVMAASLALAGVGGCGPIQPEEQALPFVDAPEFQTPGEPLLYATASLLDGYAIPILVKTTVGRPIKVEGNPQHPLTRGGTDIFAQAAVLDLYDRDRSKAVTYLGAILTWQRFQRALIEGAGARAPGRRGARHPDRHHHLADHGPPDGAAQGALSAPAALPARANRPGAPARGGPPGVRPTCITAWSAPIWCFRWRTTFLVRAPARSSMRAVFRRPGAMRSIGARCCACTWPRARRH